MFNSSSRASVAVITLFLMIAGCDLGPEAASMSESAQALNRVPAPPAPQTLLTQDLVLAQAGRTIPRGDGLLTCSSDQDCGKEFYCQKPMGSCDGQGTCEPVDPRGICTMDYTPVCGCDGQTYSNACVASKQGINIVHRGACQGELHCLTYEKTVGINAQGQNRNLTYAGNFASRQSAEEALAELLDRSVVKSDVVRGSCKLHAETLRCFRIFRPVCVTEPAELQYSNSCILQAALLEKAGESGEENSLWEERSCQPRENPVF